jgi:hypothetical protein
MENLLSEFNSEVQLQENEEYKEYIDWLFTVLNPTQEFFTYMETSPLPMKGCKI